MEPDRIVVCSCGTRIRMPDNSEATSAQCPVCHSNLSHLAEATSVAEPVMSVEARILAPHEAGVLCPICQTSIAEGESSTQCSACDQIHHHECWEEIGGCGTYGCTQSPRLEKQASLAPTRAWGDSKACPACGEKIKAIAVRCRYCETDFHTADPLERTDLIQIAREVRQKLRLRRTTLTLFLFSLLGLTAPLAGLVGSAYLMPKQDQLRRCGALYLVLAWMSFIFSGMFTVLIAVFLLFEWA